LPAGGARFASTIPAHGDREARCAKLLGDLFNSLRAALLPWGVRNAIHWDEVDVRITATQHLDQRRRIIWAIVNPTNHRHLKGGSTPGRSRMCSGGCHHLFYRPLSIQWDEKIAQRIARGVKRDRKGDLWSHLSESVNSWNHTARRDDDAALSNPTTKWIGQPINRGKDGIKVL